MKKYLPVVLLCSLLLMGCYSSKKVEKVEPEKKVIVHEPAPSTDVTIHEDSTPDDTVEHRKTTIYEKHY